MRTFVAISIVLGFAISSPCQPPVDKEKPAFEPAFKLEYASGLSSGIQYVTDVEPVQALRWEGGVPVGWVRITDEGKLRKFDLNPEPSLQRDANGRPWSPKDCKGWILMRVRPAAKGAKTQEVSVVQVVELSAVIDGKRRKLHESSGLWSGTIPAAAADDRISFGSYVAEEGKYKRTWISYTTIDGATYEFLDMTLPIDGKKK